jgi:hypothetical protein
MNLCIGSGVWPSSCPTNKSVILGVFGRLLGQTQSKDLRLRAPIGYKLSTKPTEYPRSKPLALKIRSLVIGTIPRYPEIWIFSVFGPLTQLFQRFAIPPGGGDSTREC